MANVFTEQTSKGTFIRKNPELEKVLRKIGINNKETWDKILEDGGSVQGIDELEKWGFLGNKLINIQEIPETAIQNKEVEKILLGHLFRSGTIKKDKKKRLNILVIT